MTTTIIITILILLILLMLYFRSVSGKQKATLQRQQKAKLKEPQQLEDMPRRPVPAQVTAVVREPIQVRSGKSTPAKEMTRGEFDIVGYRHLTGEAKKVILEVLQEGDPVQLVPDPDNEFDRKAIRVLFNGLRIGWVSREHYRKGELFNYLVEKKNVKVTCSYIHNYMGTPTLRGRFEVNLQA